MADDQVVTVEPEFVDLEKAIDLSMSGSAREPSESKQVDDPFLETPDNAIGPPLNLDLLAKLSHTNATRRSIIDAVARNTVGLGYSLTIERGLEESVQDADKEEVEIRKLLERLAARDNRLDQPSFTELLMAVKTDEEEVGWGFIEVSRSRADGKIDGFYHAPGRRMRRKKDRDGFLMLGMYGNTDPSVEFYSYGTKVVYDESGQPTNSLQPGRDWQTNEVLCFRLYSSESRDYGMPRDAALMLEYTGDKLAAESNISFFDSSGTPPTIIFVQGEEQRDGSKITFRVPQQTVDRIAQTLKSDGGHRHRVGIVPLPPGAKTDHVQLGQVSDRDIGFTNFRADNRSRILSSFRLSSIFISVSDLSSGRYTAEVERALSLEQVFDPEQTRYEERLNTLLTELGYEHRRFKFKRLAVENDAARRDAAEHMAEVGAITNGEYRAAHGWPPLPEAQQGQDPKPGEVPHGWNDQLIHVGLPPGADNRVAHGAGQQGLRPGIGGREAQQPAGDYGSNGSPTVKPSAGSGGPGVTQERGAEAAAFGA